MTKREMLEFADRLERIISLKDYLSYGEKQLYTAAQCLRNAVGWFVVDTLKEYDGQDGSTTATSLGSV